MKRVFGILSFAFVVLFTSCKDSTGVTSQLSHTAGEATTSQVATTAEEKNILILYFSATGNTKEVANKIGNAIGEAPIEIEPLIPYTTADLNYSNSDCRANLEQNDPNSRPEIKNTINIEPYDTIFIGYPIWWGRLPKIIYTLCDSYDMSNKVIIPFCTSGGSGISASVNELKSLEPDAIFKEGRRLSSYVLIDEINEWITDLKI